VRKNAAEALGQIAQPAPQMVIPYLEQILLKDQRKDVRCGAAIGLGYASKNHSLTVLPILEKAFNDHDESVRISVAAALSMMPCGTNLQFAIPFLIESLGFSYGAVKASRLVDWSSQIQHIQHLIIAGLCSNRNEHLLSSTPLSSLIQNYSQQLDHPGYFQAIAKKCLGENIAIFLEDNSLCCYEKGEILSIKDVPNAKERASKIQQAIKIFLNK
jgi:hypothetical protein